MKVESWLSSNPKVATVKNGKVTALKKGMATIYAVLGSHLYDTCKVTVNTSPKLSENSITVKKNKTKTIKITGKASSVKNVYTNTKKAKIISNNTATSIKIKGLKKGKTTLKIKVNEKQEGKWKQIIATPGFIGLDGLGDANINDCYTPVGTFTIDKAFGLADDPGCQMEYTKVDENYYWSGDKKYNFNELVNIKDVPDLDTENSEHISDYDYAYQYVLNMGWNSECEYDKGFAFFFHCFRVNRTYTGGCLGVPENIMKFIMQHVKPGCKITIDSLENMNGDLDEGY